MRLHLQKILQLAELFQLLFAVLKFREFWCKHPKLCIVEKDSKIKIWCDRGFDSFQVAPTRPSNPN